MLLKLNTVEQYLFHGESFGARYTEQLEVATQLTNTYAQDRYVLDVWTR